MINDDMTVAELFEMWLKDNAEDVRAKKFFLYYLSYLAEPFGSRRVNDISFKEWQIFKKSLSSKGDTWNTRMTADISERAVGSFKEVFEYGHSRFGLSDPYVRQITKSKSRPKTKQPPVNTDNLIFSSQITDVFTDEETEKMRKAVIPYKSVHISVMLCLFAGLGQSEICALRWADVELDKKLVKISKTFLRRFTYEEAAITALKEAAPYRKNAVRDVSIPAWLAGILSALKPFYKDEDYVLTGEAEPIGSGAFCYNHYPRFLEWAGVPLRPFTALRNTFVRMCFEGGMDIKEITKVIGNATENTTIRRYFTIINER